MALTKIKTDGVTNDAITSGKIPADAIGSSEIAANAVGSSELADNAVDTAAIADQAVALSKLPHGDGSSNGKFLRANNGADPTFETVSTTPEGTTVLSTGESGGTKFLREDGDGTCSWQALPASGVTVSGNVDNRVVTGDGTNLVAESGFTHNSSTQDTQIDGSNNAPVDLIIANTNNSQTAATARLTIEAGDNANNGGQLVLECNGEYHTFDSRSNGNLYLSDNGTAKFTFDGNGHLVIADGDLHVASGHGIDFSATGGPTNGSGSSELLDDYEEGTFTPTARGNNNNSSPVISGSGTYIKVGRAVHINLSFSNENGSYLPSGEYFQIHGLPFTASGTHFMGFGMNYKVVYDGSKQYYFYMPSGGTILWGYINNSDQPYQPWGTDQWDNTQWYHNNTFTYRTT